MGRLLATPTWSHDPEWCDVNRIAACIAGDQSEVAMRRLERMPRRILEKMFWQIVHLFENILEPLDYFKPHSEVEFDRVPQATEAQHDFSRIQGAQDGQSRLLARRRRR
jgi:hypothetical protein